jgi:hypothetical protein
MGNLMSTSQKSENYSDTLVYHSNQYHKFRVSIGILKQRLNETKDQMNHLEDIISKFEKVESRHDLYDPSELIDSQIFFLETLMIEHRDKFITLMKQESKYDLKYDLSDPYNGRFVSGEPDWISTSFPYFQTDKEIKDLQKIGSIEIKPKSDYCHDSVHVSKSLSESFIQVWWPINCPFEDDGYIVKGNNKDSWFWLCHEWHEKANFV